MQIVQEIGSYAGLAAILGLAVLSALYFSQARDVKRLREWAGRAPERAPEPSWMAAQPSVRPVPRAPGQSAPAGRAAVGTPRPQFPPTPAGARTAATGAAPAAAVGPAAAPPAAARAAETARDRDDDDQSVADNTANGEARDGTDDRPALSQDTVIHPPPPPLHEEEEEGDDLERPEDELGEDSTEFDAADDDYDEHEDWDETGDHPSAPEEHWEDTGDEPAVSAVPPVAPRRAAPSAPARSAGAAPHRDALPPSSGILPPYSESRPGAVAAADRPSRGGLFSSRGRAAGVIALVVLLLVALALGATQLLGGDNDTAKKAPSQPAQAPAAPGKKTPSRAGGISPASVRVAVLNGTTVSGLAAQIADSVEKQGFRLGTVTNFNDQQRAESVVLYAPGAEREAAEVGRRLKIAQREPVDAESQGVAGDATVVIVTGQDKTQ